MFSLYVCLVAIAFGLVLVSGLDLDFDKEQVHYVIMGMTNHNVVVPNCIVPCYESNCTQAALWVSNCPNTEWIAFVADSVQCKFFERDFIQSYDYEVWAVDKNRIVIPYTRKWVQDYFNDAVNYGCFLFRYYRKTMWFGMRIEY
jgi:hypothetical protein